MRSALAPLVLFGAAASAAKHYNAHASRSVSVEQLFEKLGSLSEQDLEHLSQKKLNMLCSVALRSGGVQDDLAISEIAAAYRFNGPAASSLERVVSKRCGGAKNRKRQYAEAMVDLGPDASDSTSAYQPPSSSAPPPAYSEPAPPPPQDEPHSYAAPPTTSSYEPPPPETSEPPPQWTTHPHDHEHDHHHHDHWDESTYTITVDTTLPVAPYPTPCAAEKITTGLDDCITIPVGCTTVPAYGGDHIKPCQYERITTG